MANLTISVSSITQYYASDKVTTSATAYKWGATSSAAISNAKTAAKTKAGSPGGGTPKDGEGSSNTTNRYFGSVYGEPDTGYNNTGAQAVGASGEGYNGHATCYRTRTSTIYQLKLKFTNPSVTSNLISSAYLKFTGTSISSGDTYYVIAPASTTEQTSYQKYNNNTILSSSKRSVIPSDTTSYNIDITSVLKQCIDKGAGWITLARAVTTAPSTDSQITISGTPTIEVNYTYTACGAPTSVSFTQVVKPGGSLTISWSGATSGINNAISGYNVYYKIGSAPTTSSYDGTASVSTTATSGSKAFTIASTATRGSTFYAMVQTKGNSAAGSSFYSSWKSASGGKVNSLPNAPSVSVNKGRIKSSSTSSNKDKIKFTLTAGSDNDSSQIRTIRYMTSTTSITPTPTTSNTTAIASGTEVELYQKTYYYFWTYDSLEFSSSYTSKVITVNTPPAIGSITMSAVQTYEPSVTVNNVVRNYVTNINGSASNVTKDSAATLTYQWKLKVGSGASTTSFNTSTNIATTTSLSNIDVTKYGANFNTAYKLSLRVTDDVGEYAEVDSSQIFIIPALSAITAYNQKSSGNCSNTNPVHFENGIRVNYTKNTGVTKQLQYSTSSSFPSNSTTTINLTGETYTDITLSSLSRGTSYYFKVIYTCNSISSNAPLYTYGSGTTNSNYFIYARAKDLTPISFIINSGYEVKPYTSNVISFSFNHGSALTNWDNSQDVSTNSDNIYKVKLKFGNNYYPVSESSYLTNSNFTIDDGIVSGSVGINSIPTPAWKILIGTSTSPNSNYTISLELTVINSFGAKFTTTANFTANFVEGIISIGTPELRIKTGTSTYTKIPDTYVGKSGGNRYHIFETQTLQVALSGLQCYADQSAWIYFLLGTTELGKVQVNATDWTAPTGTNRNFTLSGEKTIDYTLLRCTSSQERNYSVKVVLANNSTQTTTGGNLCSCFAMKFDPSAINFQITNSSESQQTWECTYWGGYGTSSNYYSDSYYSISAQVTYSPIINGTDGEYTPLGTDPTPIKSNGVAISSSTGDITNSLSGITYDLIYFGSIINLVLDFQSINGVEPTGTKNYQFSYINQFAYYRATPNLGYGKNFFFLNQNSPKSGRTDQLLEISTTNTRNKIYFGYQYDDTYFEIDEANGDLKINCGSWSSS